jgi:hypothetical protein
VRKHQAQDRPQDQPELQPKDRDEPIAIPLNPETALQALMQVPPEREDVSQPSAPE